MPVRDVGGSAMDEIAAPLARSGGSRLHVNVMLGCSVSVSCDEGKAPYVLIDAGPMRLLLEQGSLDAGAATVAQQLAAAARLADLVSSAVADTGRGGEP